MNKITHSWTLEDFYAERHWLMERIGLTMTQANEQLAKRLKRHGDTLKNFLNRNRPQMKA